MPRGNLNETSQEHPKGMRFNGPEYDPDYDQARLTGQCLRVFNLMRDGVWRTLGEIEAITGDPQASISAQLRHLRKKRFGEHIVNRQPRGDREHGLFEYQLIPNEEGLLGNHSEGEPGEWEIE